MAIVSEKGGIHNIHADPITLIRSAERVRDLGEVFTPTWLVRDMLNLLAMGPDKDVVAALETRCLDPACGHGQFLCETLRRKLALVIPIHQYHQTGTCKAGGKAEGSYSYDALTALANVYGVDIDGGNANDARNRLSEIMESAYRLALGKMPPPPFSNAVSAILRTNVVNANFLQPASYCFTEYVRAREGQFERRHWSAADLMLKDGTLWKCDVGPKRTCPAIHWSRMGDAN